MLKRCCALWLLSWTGFAQAGPVALEVVDSAGIVSQRFALADGQRWCLLWNHSVAGFAVRDCFAWQPPQLLLRDSHQPDFAAGLGHIEGRGVQRSDGAGGYFIEGIDQPLLGNRLPLRVGAMAVNHRIEIDGRVHSLSAAHAGERIELRVAPATVVESEQ
ncbi:MAG: DUF1850 domain-containing protein [Pseudazoarcus pumilus]|nr:DUF1850 domain-containing protein [Pseudazoarcus pumilus]